MTYFGYQLIHNIMKPTLMQRYAPMVVAANVGPGLTVNAVHTDQANLPAVDNCESVPTMSKS